MDKAGDVARRERMRVVWKTFNCPNIGVASHQAEGSISSIEIRPGQLNAPMP